MLKGSEKILQAMETLKSRLQDLQNSEKDLPRKIRKREFQGFRTNFPNLLENMYGAPIYNTRIIYEFLGEAINESRYKELKAEINIFNSQLYNEILQISKQLSALEDQYIIAKNEELINQNENTLIGPDMGLWIQSLENIPPEAKRDYFIYLLDYGWGEPIGEAMMKNYEKMASIAAENKAVVIRGTHRVHFEDEVLSWHHINGENAEDILPAILITNKHPLKFRESFRIDRIDEPNKDLKLILIPLKKLCKSTTEVVSLIERIFNDIIKGKDLDDFRIGKEMKRGLGRAVVDAIILEPKIAGIGFSFNKLINYLRQK